MNPWTVFWLITLGLLALAILTASLAALWLQARVYRANRRANISWQSPRTDIEIGDPK